jgi:large subunit ribosomal protein L4
MASLDVLDVQGKKAGSVELAADLFDVQTNVPLIHQVVVAQLAAARQGTQSAKTRGEVSGAGRKPFKQKGTGRARQGSIRAPQMRGGGMVHAVKPRGYEQRTPKKMIAAALLGAVSDRARNNRLHVINAFAIGDTPSTKAAAAVLAQITSRRNVLVVLDRSDVVSAKSLRNLAKVHFIWVDQLNSYDVLLSDDLVFTKAAFDAYTKKEA